MRRSSRASRTKAAVMDDRAFWIAVRRALLAICDAIERRWDIKAKDKMNTTRASDQLAWRTRGNAGPPPQRGRSPASNGGVRGGT
jgi:hypothetical protein